MKSIEKEYKIHATIEAVWQALVDPKVIDQWGGGPAKMSDVEGAMFSLWDGEIWGTTTHIQAPNRLQQDWFGGKWEEASKLTLELTAKDNETRIHLTQTHIPDGETDDISDGWDEYYFGPMKELLEAD